MSEIDQCQYNQSSKSGNPVKKHTRWMSNSPEVLKKLNKKCNGVNGRCTRPGGGEHETCSGSVARDAQVYPFDLCRAILMHRSRLSYGFWLGRSGWPRFLPLPPAALPPSGFRDHSG